MKKEFSCTLLALLTVMLLSGYCDASYASPFDEDSTVTTSLSGDAKSTETKASKEESESFWSKVGNKAGKIVDKVKDKASDVKEKAGDVVDTVKDKAGDAVDFVKDKAGDAVDFVKDKAGDAADFVKDKAGDAKDKVVGGYGSLTRKVNGWFNNNEVPAYVEQAIFLPGHETKEMVCQGIAYLPTSVKEPKQQAEYVFHRYILLSYYPKDSSQPSQLVVVDRGSEKVLRRFSLLKKDGSAYTGHAGGIAVAGEYVWVASGHKLFGYKIQEMLDFLNDSEAVVQTNVAGIPESLEVPAKDLICDRTFGVDSKASFVSFDGEHLWVGDFTASGKSYAPIAHHKAFSRRAWIAGYSVDEKGVPTSDVEYTFKEGDSSYTVHKPDKIIAMRDKVQGMAVCGDYVALSVSYGALNGKIAMYNNPLKTAKTEYSYKPAGQENTYTVDAWELEDKKNWINTETVAAGCEDLEYDGKNLYVTFECSSKNYCQSWMNINPTVKITENFYLLNPAKIANKK